MKAIRKLIAFALALTLLLSTGIVFATAEETKKEGGEITVAISNEPDSFDPFTVIGADAFNIVYNIYDGLLLFNPDGSLMPGLAESYTVSDDGLTYDFVLKQGIKFHDGSDFNADDVVYTYQTYIGAIGSTPVSLFANVCGVEKVSDYEVKLTLTALDAGFPYKCIRPICSSDNADNQTNPIGTGAYKFVEYIPGQSVTLEKYADYATSDETPTLDKVTFLVMSDSSAKLMALQSGDLDFAEIAAKDASILSSFNIINEVSNTVQIMGLNNRVEPFNNLKVRQALTYAVNKDMIVQAVMYGAGIPLNSHMSPALGQYYEENLTYPYDPAKAKELLAEAGYPDGFEFDLVVPSAYPRHVNTAQVIKEQLAQIGVTANIQTVEWATFLSDALTSTSSSAWIVGITGNIDPSLILDIYWSKSADGKRNWLGYHSDAFDTAFEAAQKELDPDARIQDYKDCCSILAQDVPAIYLEDTNFTKAMSMNLKGYVSYPIVYTCLRKLYLAE
ncbi:MAG: ABC transporter substrate-binding protein [Eubacteriales bacterium]|nr:ABC transporter substrate-binding protein [Eubacteriales bacterium]